MNQRVLMHNTIFCKKNFLQKFIFWSKIYAIKDHIKINGSNNIIVENDILGASEYRLADYEASLIESVLYDKLIRSSSIESLSNWGGKDYSRRLIGKRIMYEVKNIFISIYYAQAIIKKYNIKGTVYLWPHDFELNIFKYLQKIGKIPNTIKILKLAYSYLYLKNKIKFVYFFLKSLFFLEKEISSKNNNKILKRNKYRYCVYMDDGLRGWQLPPDKLLIGKDSLDPNDVLFVNRNDSDQEWPNEYKKNGYNVLNIKDVPNLIDTKPDKWLYYKKFFKVRFDVLFLIIKYPWLASTFFNYFKQRFLWGIFYKKIDVKSIISIMIADDITASLIHKKQKTKTIFLYYSTTTNILKSIRNPEVSHCHDYTYMDYDIVISSKISNEWLKTLQNKVNEYINLGPIFSDLIINRSKNKTGMLKNLQIVNAENIISFIDSPTGIYSVSNNKSYEAFLEGLLKLSAKYKNNYYLLKTKRTYAHIKKYSNIKIVNLLDKIRMNKNTIYANDFNLSAYDAIGLSDLTISGPKSSALFESFFAGKKTICYDPYLQYKDSCSMENHIPKCKASTFEEVTMLHDYWLNEINDNEFSEYLKSNISTYFDSSCGEGKSISRLRNLLYNDCTL
jgi:polysaccharide biosynthesis PFTS motif protein